MAKNRLWSDFREKYEDFVQHRGFVLIIGACVAVIAASALLSGKTTLTTTVVPTPPVVSAAPVSLSQEETLAEATAAQPEATAAPIAWQHPLASISLLRGFDNRRMTRMDNGVWQVHDAADLSGEYGAPVYAMADGIVTTVNEDKGHGASIVIAHSHDITTEYACLSTQAGLLVGDPVRAGQTIGFVGREMTAEHTMVPHLHLRVTREGTPVDPMLFITR